jgi:hypothetical protein
MALEQMDLAVDVVDESDASSEQVDRTDAPGRDPAITIGNLVVDVAGSQHGFRPLGNRPARINPFLDPLLAIVEDSLVPLSGL